MLDHKDINEQIRNIINACKKVDRFSVVYAINYGLHLPEFVSTYITRVRNDGKLEIETRDEDKEDNTVYVSERVEIEDETQALFAKYWNAKYAEL